MCIQMLLKYVFELKANIAMEIFKIKMKLFSFFVKCYEMKSCLEIS